MAGATVLGSNHYETLGIHPNATAAEIERAFRHELHPFMPHVVGGVAAASVAYATLRDPVKRRAYDLEHGFVVPAPSLSSAARPLVVTGGGWQMGNARALRTMPPLAAEALATPEMERPPEPAPEIDEKVISPVPPEPAPSPVRREAASPFLLANDGPRPAQVILAMDEAEDVAIGGRKGMVALGAVAAIAIAGGLLGWLAGSTADEANVTEAVAPLPDAKPRDLSIITPVPAAADEPIAIAPTPVRRRPSQRATQRAVDAPPSLPEADAPPIATSNESAVDALAPTPENAAMPIGNVAAARTIDRIGYRCGSVSASENVGGGVFTLTCSSGQRFRASPRNGRYRFKRI